jgi:hypothetical protein
MMKNKMKNTVKIKQEPIATDILTKNFKIRKINMKTKIVISSLLTVVFLVAFSSCNITKKAGTNSAFGSRVIQSDDSNSSDLTDETILNNSINNNSQGMSVGNSEYYNPENIGDNLGSKTDGTIEDNSGYTEEEILNDNPNSDGEDVNLDTFENTLASDGQFINVSQDEIDPDNNVSLETANVDEDIYTNVIWVPSSNYVYAGWNPYTNGRWVWTRYGWTWVSHYRWGRTYHYGRWWYSSRYGWVWSPGRRWAPAWVVWGHHRNYEGWHPISPRIHIKRKGIVSPVMPHNQQNGWVIVKKNDFTKTVNSNTIIPNTKKSDIIKNSTTSITLKQDGKRLFNENPNINKKEIVLVNKNENNTVVPVTTKQKPNNTNSVITQSPNNKQNINTTINNKKNNTEVLNKEKETQRKVTVYKNSTVTSVPISTTRETPKKVTENSNNGTLSTNQNNSRNSTTNVNKNNRTVNVNKSNNENKTVVKETQKKTVETKPITVEKNVNNNNSRNNNNVTKTYTPTNTTPQVNTSKPVEKTNNPVKTENTNRTVNTTPKIEQSPKVKTEPKNDSPQKNITKKGN